MVVKKHFELCINGKNRELTFVNIAYFVNKKKD